MGPYLLTASKFRIRNIVTPARAFLPFSLLGPLVSGRYSVACSYPTHIRWKCIVLRKSPCRSKKSQGQGQGIISTRLGIEYMLAYITQASCTRAAQLINDQSWKAFEMAVLFKRYSVRGPWQVENRFDCRAVVTVEYLVSEPPYKGWPFLPRYQSFRSRRSR